MDNKRCSTREKQDIVNVVTRTLLLVCGFKWDLFFVSVSLGDCALLYQGRPTNGVDEVMSDRTCSILDDG